MSTHYYTTIEAFLLHTCAGDSISGISCIASTRKASDIVHTGCDRVAASVVRRTLVDICVNTQKDQ